MRLRCGEHVDFDCMGMHGIIVNMHQFYVSVGRNMLLRMLQRSKSSHRVR